MIGIDPTLGYWIAKEHWGNGYMSDAVDALMHYLFQRYPIEKISAYANLDNIGSQRVLKKCGFQNVGEEDQKSPARGTMTASIDLTLSYVTRTHAGLFLRGF